ncbi:helicase C-terminal domain-containing protein [Halocalculus aciditolerans]|uniref:Helicase n=1 Tax=Halocalculus aciditolerans TaxID=1383812 RepID=A0A830EZ35_9EURY|nr:ATP-dependent DNA helicase [Halocalculus aciditolerans]GGL46408.1 helicase [Halocalculus aciditolerans]
MKSARIHEEFPAPSYRGTQERALSDVRDAFEAGNDVVLVRAPTGSGKSLLARAIMGCADRADEVSPSEPTGAYYTTPQVSQLDDVAEDDLLEDLKLIRGKRNYSCILPSEENTPVDRAPCARERGYDCAVKHRCPYFADRSIASARDYAAMTLAYFMRTAGSEVFRTRDVCVIDEAHGLAEWAEMYATIELSPRTVPIWGDLNVPDVDGRVEGAARFADRVIAASESAKDELLGQDELTADEAAERDRLQELIGELEWFVEDYRDHESATTWVVDQDGSDITVKPMNPERYLKHTVWDRANRFALLSATILNKQAFCRSVGLDPSNVALVDVDHTFPVENRPLYDVTQGRMTYDERDATLPKVAETIGRVMAAHPEEKGIVHCHSYGIQERLHDHLRELGLGDRVRTHASENRDAELEAWKASDDPEAFLSVKMEEALDLKGDLARWQVLCKAPFLNTGDSRVAQRLEDGQWAWYYRAALRTLIQACGRVVRAPDDYGDTYIVDGSILDVFERARTDMPPWFAEQVDRMSEPELPELDAELATAATSEGTPTSRTQSTPTNTAENDGKRSAARASDESSAGESEGSSRERSSPMADVWDVD